MRMCRDHGADEVINYRVEDFRERVLALTGDQGVNALQFRFIGAVDLTAVTTAYSDEFYNRVGISAIFLD